MKFTFTEKTTLTEYLDYWLDNYGCKTIGNSTYDSYRDYIDKHIAPVIGDIPMSELTLSVMQDYFNEHELTGNLRNGGRLAPKTMDNLKKMLSKAMEKAIDLDFIVKNPVRRVEISRIVKPDIRVLTRSEEKLLLDNVLTDEYREYGFAIWLALRFGLRIGEICGLKWSDFDFNKRLLHIRRTIHRNTNRTPNAKTKTILMEGTPKTQSSIRDIPFTEAVCDTIMSEMYKRKRSDYYDVRHADSQMRDFVFINNIGGYAEPKTLNSFFKNMCKKIGIAEAYHFHSIRHTFGTRAAEKNLNTKIISTIMGHADVQITLNTYTHVLADAAYEVMEVMQE